MTENLCFVPSEYGQWRVYMSTNYFCHRLEAGWSVKSNQFKSLQWKQEKISEQEKKIILDVLTRAQKTEENEKKRIR